MSKAEREKEQRGISCRYLQIPDVHPRANPVCKSVSKFKSLQPPAIYSTSVCRAKVGVLFFQPQAIYSTSVYRATGGRMGVEIVYLCLKICHSLVLHTLHINS